MASWTLGRVITFAACTGAGYILGASIGDALFKYFYGIKSIDFVSAESIDRLPGEVFSAVSQLPDDESALTESCLWIASHYHVILARIVNVVKRRDRYTEIFCVVKPKPSLFDFRSYHLELTSYQSITGLTSVWRRILLTSGRRPLVDLQCTIIDDCCLLFCSFRSATNGFVDDVGVVDVEFTGRNNEEVVTPPSVYGAECPACLDGEWANLVSSRTVCRVFATKVHDDDDLLTLVVTSESRPNTMGLLKYWKNPVTKRYDIRREVGVDMHEHVQPRFFDAISQYGNFLCFLRGRYFGIFNLVTFDMVLPPVKITLPSIAAFRFYTTVNFGNFFVGHRRWHVRKHLRTFGDCHDDPLTYFYGFEIFRLRRVDPDPLSVMTARLVYGRFSKLSTKIDRRRILITESPHEIERYAKSVLLNLTK